MTPCNNWVLTILEVLRLLVLTGLACISCAATAAEFQVQSQGFATLNYRVSDEDKAYRAFIDKDGTFKNGSVVGLQADASYGPNWSGTLRGKVSADNESDQGVESRISWGSITYSPTESLSFSVGRMRAGIYRDAANLEVGSTYVPLSLAPELYFSENLIRYDGFKVQYRSLDKDDNETSFELFDGKVDTPFRVFDDRLGAANYLKARLGLRGFRVSRITADDTQMYFTAIQATVPDFSNYRIHALTAGLAINLPRNVTMEIDLAHYSPRSGSAGQDSQRAAILFHRPYGRWIPYVSASLGEQVNQGQPDRQQMSMRLGTAYNLDVKTRLKAEIEHVSVGDEDLMNDGLLSNQSFTVLGLSYNKLF